MKKFQKMNTKKTALFILFNVFSLIAYSQSYPEINELIKLSSMSISEVDEYLLTKGFRFFAQRNSGLDYFNGDKNQYIYLQTFNDSKNKLVEYRFLCDGSNFDDLKKNVTLNGFVKDTEYVQSGTFYFIYKKNNMEAKFMRWTIDNGNTYSSCQYHYMVDLIIKE